VHPDTFQGDTPALVRSIRALLDLDTAGALSGQLGGHARLLLAAAGRRLDPTVFCEDGGCPRQPAPHVCSAPAPVTLDFDSCDVGALSSHIGVAAPAIVRRLQEQGVHMMVNDYVTREQACMIAASYGIAVAPRRGAVKRR
jgi:hypothetical protein